MTSHERLQLTDCDRERDDNSASILSSNEFTGSYFPEKCLREILGGGRSSGSWSENPKKNYTYFHG